LTRLLPRTKCGSFSSLNESCPEGVQPLKATTSHRAQTPPANLIQKDMTGT
jgi:hypothetical protein